MVVSLVVKSACHFWGAYHADTSVDVGVVEGFGCVGAVSGACAVGEGVADSCDPCVLLGELGLVEVHFGEAVHVSFQTFRAFQDLFALVCPVSFGNAVKVLEDETEGVDRFCWEFHSVAVVFFIIWEYRVTVLTRSDRAVCGICGVS